MDEYALIQEYRFMAGYLGKEMRANHESP
jgi:hypothetical protein